VKSQNVRTGGLRARRDAGYRWKTGAVRRCDPRIKARCTLAAPSGCALVPSG